MTEEQIRQIVREELDRREMSLNEALLTLVRVLIVREELDRREMSLNEALLTLVRVLKDQLESADRPALPPGQETSWQDFEKARAAHKSNNPESEEAT